MKLCSLPFNPPNIIIKIELFNRQFSRSLPQLLKRTDKFYSRCKCLFFLINYRTCKFDNNIYLTKIFYLMVNITLVENIKETYAVWEFDSKIGYYVISSDDVIQPDQNMMAPRMRNSYEFRLFQVPSYFGRAVVTFYHHFWILWPRISWVHCFNRSFLKLSYGWCFLKAYGFHNFYQ